jgi:hypothetical protein
MTKPEFIELVKIALNGGTPPAKTEGKFHDVVIEKHLGMAYSTIVGQIQDPFLLDSFCFVFRKVEVEYDDEVDLKYAKLPAPIMNTPFFVGLRQVSPMKNQDISFFIRKNGSQPVWSNMEVSSTFTKNALWIEGDRIYFPIIDDNYKLLLVKMILPFDKLPEDYEFDIPGGTSGAMFMQTLEQMRIQLEIPENTRNDNNANTK